MEQDRAQATPTASGSTAPCVECGRSFPTRDMLQYGQYYVCADDKPVFQQKLAEGVFNPAKMKYAGFWLRFAAVFIDGIITYLIMIPVMMLTAYGRTAQSSPFTLGTGISMIFSVVFGLSYYIFFWGKFGATPGKMAVKIKIVRANGKDIGFALALGRYFAYILSSFTLGIGFIMAGIDKEKRSLHDRICGTRVIHVG